MLNLFEDWSKSITSLRKEAKELSWLILCKKVNLSNYSNSLSSDKNSKYLIECINNLEQINRGWTELFWTNWTSPSCLLCHRSLYQISLQFAGLYSSHLVVFDSYPYINLCMRWKIKLVRVDLYSYGHKSCKLYRSDFEDIDHDLRSTQFHYIEIHLGYLY